MTRDRVRARDRRRRALERGADGSERRRRGRGDLRDFTEQRRAEAEQRRLAEEQAALRRVATLVAGNAPPEQVFQTVTEEVCRLLGLRDRRAPSLRGRANVDDRRQVRRADRAVRARQRRSRSRWARRWQVLADRSSRPVELRGLVGPGVAELRALGFRAQRRRADHGRRRRPGARSSSRSARTSRCRSRPSAACRRSPSSSGSRSRAPHARDELAASRLRIVEASDTERRRHRAQPARRRAAAAGRALGRAAARPGEAARRRPTRPRSCSRTLSEELSEALTELRELAQGIHPAVLTERGLEAALRGAGRPRAARRSRSTSTCPSACRSRSRRPPTTPSPRRSRTSPSTPTPARPPSASSARAAGSLVEIADDGVGGADADRGSGLRGLRDRVETLDGELVRRERAGTGHAACAPSFPSDSASLATGRRGRMTLTFFFSDLEDSSGLADRLGAGYAASSTRCASCSARRSQRAGGREVDSRGDELFCVFAEPSAAAAAALEIQRAFAARAWPARGARARADRPALRRGRERAGDGFVGIDVHRASRICQAGHGGQVLASAGGGRPLSARPRAELGEFEFRGLREPERIFQLVGRRPRRPSSRRSATSARTTAASPR